MSATVVSVAGLCKSYGRTVAIRDLSFEVYAGEIFGLIGPNGAGKTTTMECIEGLRSADAGRVSVLGLDPMRDARSLKQRVGVQLQEAQLQKRITVREAVALWASLYDHPVNGDWLLDQLGLTEKRHAWFMTLSGGQKQRLQIALALVNDPEVVFFDELTTGLDPQARRTIWDLVRGIRARGKTVFLTTHLMEEAERLCDRVAIVDHGRLVDVGTPADLVARHCPEAAVVLRLGEARGREILQALPSTIAMTEDGDDLTIRGRAAGLVTDVIHAIATHRLPVTAFRTVAPTLEDVFLRLTGHAIRD